MSIKLRGYKLNIKNWVLTVASVFAFVLAPFYGVVADYVASATSGNNSITYNFDSYSGGTTWGSDWSFKGTEPYRTGNDCGILENCVKFNDNGDSATLTLPAGKTASAISFYLKQHSSSPHLSSLVLTEYNGSTQLASTTVMDSANGTVLATGTNKLVFTMTKDQNGNNLAFDDVVVTTADASTPAPVVTKVDAYYVDKGSYTGVMIDFKTENIGINTVGSIELRVNGGDGSSSSTYSTASLASDYHSTTGSMTGTVIVKGSRTSSSWTPQVGNWPVTATPVLADVTITLLNGDIITGHDDTIGTSLATWDQVRPADTTPPSNLTLGYLDGTALSPIAPDTYVVKDTTKKLRLGWTNNFTPIQEKIVITTPEGSLNQYNLLGAPWDNAHLDSVVTKRLGVQGEGIYTYRVAAKNSDGVWSQPSAQTITVIYDRSGPKASFTTATPSFVNGNFAVAGEASDNVKLKGVFFDVRDANGWVAGCVAGTMAENYSSDQKSATPSCTINTANLLDGHTYTLRIHAGDYANYGGGESRTITVDRTLPVIQIDGTAPKLTYKLTDGLSVHVIDSNLSNTEVNRTDAQAPSNDKHWNYIGAWFGLSWLKDGTYDLTAHDKAGNSTTASFTTDRTRPHVDGVVSGAATKDGINYNPVELEVTATDDIHQGWFNSGVKVVTGNIYKVGQSGVNKPNSSTTQNSLVVDLSSLSDGEYYIRYNAADGVGNTSNTETYYFTVDHTAPTGTITYSNNNGNQLTTNDVIATLATDENVQDITGWTKSGTDPHVFTKTFTSNGKFSVTFSDIAGNTTTLNGEIKRIDRQAPQITGVNDGDIVNHSVQLTIFDPAYEGAFGFDANQGLKINGSEVKTTEKAGHYFVTNTYITKDGYYTVTATDKAGNATTIHFTIDTTSPDKPVLSWLGDGGVAATNGQTNIQKGTLSWTEASSDVDHYVYKFWTNIPGYQDNPSNPWSDSHTYVVKTADGGHVITDFADKQGTYFFCVEAVDAAGNNSSCSDVLAIVYDATNPVVLLTVPATAVSAAQNNPASLNYKVDDDNLDSYQLTVNGVELQSGTVNADGTFDWDLTGLASGDYTITLTATDKAGNVSTDSKTVTVDNSAPDNFTAGVNLLGGINTSRTFSGTSEPGSIVTVEVHSTVTSQSVTADADGSWSLTFDGLEIGSHTAYVTATDDFGNTTTSIDIPFTVTEAGRGGAASRNATATTRPSPLVLAVATPTTATPGVLGASDSKTDGTDQNKTGDSDVKGAEDTKNTADNGNKMLGLSWYWWILILLVAGLIIWWIVASRRKDDK